MADAAEVVEEMHGRGAGPGFGVSSNAIDIVCPLLQFLNECGRLGVVFLLNLCIRHAHDAVFNGTGVGCVAEAARVEGKLVRAARDILHCNGPRIINVAISIRASNQVRQMQVRYRCNNSWETYASVRLKFSSSTEHELSK